MSPTVRSMRGDPVGPDGLSDRDRAKLEARARLRTAAIERMKTAASGERPAPAPPDQTLLDAVDPAEDPIPAERPGSPTWAARQEAPIPPHTLAVLQQIDAQVDALLDLTQSLREAVQADADLQARVREIVDLTARRAAPDAS